MRKRIVSNPNETVCSGDNVSSGTQTLEHLGGVLRESMTGRPVVIERGLESLSGSASASRANRHTTADHHGVESSEVDGSRVNPGRSTRSETRVQVGPTSDGVGNHVKNHTRANDYSVDGSRVNPVRVNPDGPASHGESHGS